MIPIEALQPGTCFVGNINGAEMRIIKIQNNNAVIMDINSGKVFSYGLAALSRCNITIAKEG